MDDESKMRDIFRRPDFVSLFIAVLDNPTDRFRLGVLTDWLTENGVEVKVKVKVKSK